MLKLLYFAFVYPYLLYGIEIYGSTNHLVNLKNWTIEFFEFGKNRSIRTNHIELYKYYDTLPLTLLHNYQILLFLQRFYHHSYTLPDVFVTYFTQISSIYNYNTRGKRNLYFSTTETETGKKLSRIKVAYYGINFQALKQCFKHRIKDYLISNYIA